MIRTAKHDAANADLVKTAEALIAACHDRALARAALSKAKAVWVKAHADWAKALRAVKKARGGK